VAGNLVGPDVVPSSSGTPHLFISQGHNLIGASAGGDGFVNGVNGDQVGTLAVPIDAHLGPLQNNGGPTLTHALLTGSPAINAGDNTGAPATDQRGFPRIVGGIIDIGAYELQSLPCPTPPINVHVYSGFNPSGGGAPYSGLVGSFNVSGVTFASDFGYSWHPFGLSDFGADIFGALSVPVAGTYTFTLDSDDGSLLFIDGVLVVDNGNGHSPTTISGTATLSAGTHPFEIQFFECCSGPSGVDLILPPGVSYACASDCTLTCPDDISVDNDQGTCGAVVNYAPPIASDTCSGSLLCIPPPGSTFPVGITVVTCIVTNSNNPLSATCSFKVTVNDTEPPSASYTTVKAFQTFPNPLRRVGSFKLFASDNCDPDPLIYINDSATGFVAGPFHNGDQVEIAKGPSLSNSQHPPASGPNSAVIFLEGGARMYSVDSAGNSSPITKVL